MSIDAESTSPVEFEGLLRQKLPEILIEYGEFRYEIMGIMAEVFASKDDFKQVLEEIRKLREDSNQRFEEMYRNQRGVGWRCLLLEVVSVTGWKTSSRRRWSNFQDRVSKQSSIWC